MSKTMAVGALVAAVMVGMGLALWWRYGLLVVLAEPTWFCFSR